MIADRASKDQPSVRTAIEVERPVSSVYLKIAVGCFSFAQIDNPAAVQINLECRGAAKGLLG